MKIATVLSFNRFFGHCKERRDGHDDDDDDEKHTRTE